MEIIRGPRANAPLIHIHRIERTVHGNGIGIKVFGEMLIAAKEFVYARELKLNTIQDSRSPSNPRQQIGVRGNGRPSGLEILEPRMAQGRRLPQLHEGGRHLL